MGENLNELKKITKIPLKKMTVNEETFNLILKSFGYKIKNLKEYQYGYKEKNIIYTDGRDLIIVRRRLVLLNLLEKDPRDFWYQVYIHKEIEQIEPIIENNCGISPGGAIKKINGIIHKYYTEEEKIEIFKNHEKEDSKILHKPINTQFDKILRFENCYYYDANGAYASELTKMFPKCDEEFKEMYVHRHDNNNKFKNCFNYYVGCLTMNPQKLEECLKGNKHIRDLYTNTRHYIVDNITNKMNKLITELNYARRIYINTDGMIVQHPKNVIDHSEQIGEFKIEYQGPVYTYNDKNYSIVQYGDEIKGNLPLELRKYVDLRQGKVVHYEKILSKDCMIYEYKNIEVEIKKEIKIYE